MQVYQSAFAIEAFLVETFSFYTVNH